MLIVRSRNQIPIRLTEERWQHIILLHPELATERDRVLRPVSEPDLIQQGDFGELLAIRSYLHTPLTSKSMVVTYREIERADGFVVTAYFASRTSSRRRLLWKR